MKYRIVEVKSNSDTLAYAIEQKFLFLWWRVHPGLAFVYREGAESQIDKMINRDNLSKYRIVKRQFQGRDQFVPQYKSLWGWKDCMNTGAYPSTLEEAKAQIDKVINEKDGENVVWRGDSL